MTLTPLPAALNMWFGTYTFASGSKYVGELKDDKRNGQGTYTFASGEKYVGTFKDDKRNGKARPPLPMALNMLVSSRTASTTGKGL